MPIEPAARPPLVRPRQGRVIAGVAEGVAAHLGLPVRAVRVALVVASFAGGAGALLYAWLWALVPSVETVPPARPAGDPVGRGPASPASIAGPTRAAAPAGPGAAAARIAGGHGGDLLIGLLLLVAGLALLASRLGWDIQLGLVLPLLVVGAGAVLAYTQLDEVERSRWAARAGGPGRAALLRIVGGLVLVLLGVLLVVVRGTNLTDVGRIVIAVIAVLGGGGLVLAPWGVRLWRELDAERGARIREAERAEIAAHLHDSVLQTLALIQRSSADPAQVTRLARAQERDLRGYLYGSRTAGAGTLAGEVREIAEDVEDRHGVAVELVVVGDRVLDDRGQALVAALREAIVNAAKHAGPPVSVYVEAGPDGLEAFVRDRGPGFDLAAVGEDRLGVRESILARMQRHGGHATVRSAAGEGTEVRLAMPEHAPQAPPPDAADAQVDAAPQISPEGAGR